MHFLALSGIILTTGVIFGNAAPLSTIATATPSESILYWDIERYRLQTSDARVRSMEFWLTARGDGIAYKRQHCTAQWLVGAIPQAGNSQPFECEDEAGNRTWWQPSENLMNMDPSKERWSLAISQSIKTKSSGCIAFEGRIDMVDIQMKDGYPNDPEPVLLTNCTNSVCRFYGGIGGPRRRVNASSAIPKDDCEEIPTSLIH